MERQPSVEPVGDKPINAGDVSESMETRFVRVKAGGGAPAWEEVTVLAASEAEASPGAIPAAPEAAANTEPAPAEAGPAPEQAAPKGPDRSSDEQWKDYETARKAKLGEAVYAETIERERAFVEARKKMSPEEKQQERNTVWDKLLDEKTPEAEREKLKTELKDKYGNSFELREKLNEFRRSRTTVGVLQQNLGSSLNPLEGSKRLERVNEFLKLQKIEEALASDAPERAASTKAREEAWQKMGEEEKTYLKTLAWHEESKIEYIGASSRRKWKEQQRQAEEAGALHAGENWERSRRAWRSLGDHNLEDRLTAHGENNTWLRRVGGRMLSRRAAVSAVLMGGAWLVPGVGTGALALRRAMSGTGVTFTSYDFMRRAREAKAEKIDATKLGEMETSALEEKMADLEALAAVSGARMVRGETYQALKREMIKRSSGQDQEALTKSIRELDDVLRDKQLEEVKVNRSQKFKAVGIGVLGAFGLQAISGARQLFEHGPADAAGKSLTALSELKTQIQEFTDKIRGLPTQRATELLAQGHEHLRLESLQKALHVAGMHTAEEVGQATKEAAALPEHVMKAAELGKPLFNSHLEFARPTFASVMHGTEHATASAGAPAKVGEFVVPRIDTHLNTDIVRHPLFELKPTANLEKAHEAIAGTVRKGGSAWQAAHDLVKSGKMTAAEFSKAWSSEASVVKLPSGATVHISELGLTHQGDQVMLVEAHDGVPAHFEVADFAKDKLHLGSNEDLWQTVHDSGHKMPGWLQHAHDVRLHETALDSATPEEVAYMEGGTVEGFDSHVAELPVGRSFNELMATTLTPEEAPLHQELFDLSARRALESGEPLRLAWGTLTFARDHVGKLLGYHFDELLSPGERFRLAEQATKELLRPDYEQAIEETTAASIRHSGEAIAGEAHEALMADNIGRAKQAALYLYEMRTAERALPDPDSPEARFLHKAIKEYLKNATKGLGKIFKEN